MLAGSGFIVTPEQAETLGLSHIVGLEQHIRHYRNGRDITQNPRGAMVIDLFGLTTEQVRERFPALYQWVLERVKPDRDQNNRQRLREVWWYFAEPRKALRGYLVGLGRYIATVETAKHRFFVFLDDSILPDHMLIAIALDDAYFHGVLSSRIHVCWALAAGGRLGVGNDPRYNKTRCFETFPFPNASDAQKARIRELAEQLDAYRKRQQAQHPDLTMTGMYNVLEKLRVGEELTAKDKSIHEQGLVSVLKQIHDELDAAVFDAYGWADLLPSPSGRGAGGEGRDEQILERLVALNAERAAEEKQGIIRWLRPAFQNPTGRQATQTDIDIDIDIEAAAVEVKAIKQPWPKTLAEQAQAVRGMLTGAPANTAEIARQFERAKPERVAELLETLAALGQARILEDGRFTIG
ncbi:MAG: type IIL restriction-modification enzyme MmeI [Gammaproteobacteria bacterium]